MSLSSSRLTDDEVVEERLMKNSATSMWNLFGEP